jgi:hypothetical protein
MTSVLIATNRLLLSGDAPSFGETFSALGPSELRFAWAIQEAGESTYRIEVVPEDQSNPGSTLPSESLLGRVLTEIKAGRMSNNWVLYVHGYNNTFAESVRSAIRLAQSYSSRTTNTDLGDVAVILFSWPSDPGGTWAITKDPIGAYRRTQRTAELSGTALERLLQRLLQFFVIKASMDPGMNRLRFNAIFHSLGNYLLQQTHLPAGGPLFDLLTLHQADVNTANHSTWVDQLTIARRLWVTINASDDVLRISDVINQERLGTAQSGLNGTRPVYLDVTGMGNLATSHNLFTGKHANPKLQLICHRLLVGYPWPLLGLLGGSNFYHHRPSNSWRVRGDQAGLATEALGEFRGPEG